MRQHRLVIIDNASEARTPQYAGAENDAAVTSAVLRPAAELASLGIIDGARVTESPPAVVVLHHAGAHGDSRGSTAFAQHADLVLQLRRKDPDEPESVLYVSLGEGTRIAPPALPPAVRFRGVAPAPVIPERVRRDAPRTQKDEAAPEPSARPRSAAILSVLAKAPLGTNAIRDVVGGSKRDVVAELKLLETDGVIERRDGLFHVCEDS